MNDDPQSPTVSVYALVSRDGRLLLLPGPEPDTYVLPGGTVVSGDPVEHRLRRTLQQELETTAADIGFYAAVEHSNHDEDHGTRSELALLFDVTPVGPDCRTRSGRHWWVDERELAAIRLHPKVVKDLLIRGSLLPPKSWWGWTP